jgi:hypothetical protein
MNPPTKEMISAPISIGIFPHFSKEEAIRYSSSVVEKIMIKEWLA